MTVAASVQFEPLFGAPQRNLDVVTQLAFQAAVQGARLIVFPELSMSGYVLKDVHEASMHAQTSDGYQTQALHEVACALNAYIAFGYVELCEGKLYNAAALVGPMGLMGNVRKNNLRGSDFLWASPGQSSFPVVVTPFGRLGMLICKDASNVPRPSQPMVENNVKFYPKMSVDTVLLMTAGATNTTGPDAEWVNLAESLNCNAVVAGRVGTEHDIKFTGGSCIIDRSLKVWREGSKFADADVVGGKLL